MKISLWDGYGAGRMPFACPQDPFEPYLTVYPAAQKRSAVVVCPGGAYCGRASYEGDDVGKWLSSLGLTAYVLEYRVAPSQAPAQPADMMRAMRLARNDAAKRHIPKVGVMGFSAGGHLAAMASVHYDHPFYEPFDQIDQLSARPDFTILCYSVIDMGPYRHDWSRRFLLGESPSEEQIRFYSPQYFVTKETPPAFLWHTAEDQSVPAFNSMLYAEALRTHGVPVELHLFPYGAHGKGLAEDDPYLGRWKDLLQAWLAQMKVL